MTVDRAEIFRRGVVQVAGVLDRKEAGMLVEEGVRQIGFPMKLAVHEEDLTEDEAARIIEELPPSALPVLITYWTRPRDILDLCRRLGVRSVQVHAPLSAVEARDLRESAPHFLLIKSLVVKEDNGAELESCVKELSPFVDAFITDTFDAASGACGATGKTHDWGVSRKLVEISPRPVILAGGLTPGNVRRAILQVRPAGVDVHTGVEGPDGRKDRRLVRELVSEAARAFEEKALKPSPRVSPSR